MAEQCLLQMSHINFHLNWSKIANESLIINTTNFSFNLITEVPEPSYGLPELASEERIKELNTKKRAKVMTQSVARKVQKVIEALDEASILEEEQRLLKKEKKEKEN